MTDRVTAAARALCKMTSKEVGIEEDRNWELNSDLFIADAKTALDAADEVQPIIVDKRIKRLEALVRSYRDKERMRREKESV